MKRLPLVVVALIAAAGFAALGGWQVERLAWKRALIARVEAGLTAPPAPVTDWRGVAEYRKVRLTGRFRYDRETLVKAVTTHGEGFWVMTPLDTGRGLVLVNRGFVPTPATPRRPGSERPVAVTGLARVAEPGGGFLRSNDPAQDRWYSRDVAAIAKARGLGPVAPMFVDAVAAPGARGYPLSGLTVVRFRNNHLAYALTWFALAILSLVAATLVLRRGRR